jgi:hypothetical protein
LVLRDFLDLEVFEIFLEAFFDDFLDFFAGTFFPSRRASERPIAMACLRLVTFLPDLPLFNVPFLRFFIARSTFFAKALEYFRAIDRPPISPLSISSGKSTGSLIFFPTA